MSDFIPQEARFTGRKMLFAIVAFFGVIIAVNATMLTLAVQSFGGLVVPNSYVASQNFNEDVKASQSQPIRGWTLDLTTEPETLALSVRDADGSAVRGLDLSLTVARPTHERSTVTVPLREVGPGKYVGNALLERGQWTGTIKASDGQTRTLTFNHRKSAP